MRRGAVELRRGAEEELRLASRLCPCCKDRKDEGADVVVGGGGGASLCAHLGAQKRLLVQGKGAGTAPLLTPCSPDSTSACSTQGHAIHLADAPPPNTLLMLFTLNTGFSGAITPISSAAKLQSLQRAP
eukprot:365813-Chlamydomonas_euryale.AAC.3